VSASHGNVPLFKVLTEDGEGDEVAVEGQDPGMAARETSQEVGFHFVAAAGQGTGGVEQAPVAVGLGFVATHR